MARLTLSGHETFSCRHFWLKKGYDFVQAGEYKFSDGDAVIQLGVGKNMVASIRFWMKAFDLMKEDDQSTESTEIADFIFGKNGVDPFLENPATVWLLHYMLVKSDYASIYSIIFNEVRGQRPEFNENYVIAHLNGRLEEEGQVVSPSTITKDIKTFLKNYVRPKSKKNIEEEWSGLLLELDLIQVLPFKENGAQKYKIENKERSIIPASLILFAILRYKPDASSLTFQELMNGKGSPGRIFALTADGLMNKIEEITQQYDSIVYSSDGGIQQIQILDKSLTKVENQLSILSAIYE